MASSDRQRRILDSLRQQRQVEVTELASQMGCSEMTIRRDLEVLAELGAAKRVRGGAVSLLRGEETPHGARINIALDAKRAIAEAAVDMIEDGETVIVDSGTTAREVALRLIGRRITAMPLSLHVATILARGPQIRMIMPGGEVRPGEQTFVGPLVEQTLNHLRFDTMILGCCGIDALHGVTAHDVGDAIVKRASIEASSRVIAVTDSAKLGKVTFARICPLTAVDLLLTDTPEDDPIMLEFIAAGLSVRSVSDMGSRRD